MAKYFDTEFRVDKYSALDGKTTVAFIQERKETGEPFTIKVNQSGMSFSGSMDQPISDKVQLNDLARLIGDAWKEHMKLVPKLTSSLSGH